MDRATARRIAAHRRSGAGGALGEFAADGLVAGRRALLAEVDHALAGAAAGGPGARDPELEELRTFVAGVLVCACCDAEIPATTMAGFAEVETDGVPRPAHAACAEARDTARASSPPGVSVR